MGTKALVEIQIPPELLQEIEERVRLRVLADVEALLAEARPRSEPAPEIVFAKLGAYAKRVGLSLRTLRDLIDEGLPTIGSGRLRRVDVEAADRWLRGRAPRSENDASSSVTSRRNGGSSP
jgi:hypothetical protein